MTVLLLCYPMEREKKKRFYTSNQKDIAHNESYTIKIDDNPQEKDEKEGNEMEIDSILVVLEELIPFACCKVNSSKACQCIVNYLYKLKHEKQKLPRNYQKKLYFMFRRVRNTNNSCAKVYATRGIGILCEMAGSLQSLSK